MKHILYILFLMLPLGVAAQGARYGALSYDILLKAMPEYSAAQANLDTLRMAYDKEMVRNEAEFQRKFSEFLQGQKDFPTNIMQKRQKELQTLMEQSVAFRQEVQKLLAQAEADALKPVRQKLDEAIKAVGSEQSLSFILNTDGGTVPFIGATGEVIDVMPHVLEKLMSTEQEEEQEQE